MFDTLELTSIVSYYHALKVGFYLDYGERYKLDKYNLERV